MPNTDNKGKLLPAF